MASRLSMIDLKLMASKGDMDAQYVLGNCYFRGEGVTEDINEAIKWLTKASEQGHEDAKETLKDAQYYLGNRYIPRKGRNNGINDINKAIKWLTKASNQGHEDAKKTLEELLILQEKFSIKNIASNEVFIDNKTGFMLTFDDYSTFKEAGERLNSFNFAGYSDWRLPTIDEAANLYLPSLFKIYLNSGLSFEMKIWLAKKEQKPLDKNSNFETFVTPFDLIHRPAKESADPELDYALTLLVRGNSTSNKK